MRYVGTAWRMDVNTDVVEEAGMNAQIVLSRGTKFYQGNVNLKVILFD